VAHAHTIELRMPEEPMLCTLLLVARAASGETLAENYLHYYVSSSYPAEREETPRSLILRGAVAGWESASWLSYSSDREKVRAEDACYGMGNGYYEWDFPLGDADLSKAHRIKVLCEASSHRSDWPQTDSDIFPTTLEISLNDLRLYKAVLRNHPHDARGVLSYWRGGLGAYGYLTHAFAEGEAIQAVHAATSDNTLRLRCAVPADALAQGGLMIYGAECGRFPIPPTVIVEW
jgi:hypothetical protein